jgi:hypothetical protein
VADREFIRKASRVWFPDLGAVCGRCGSGQAGAGRRSTRLLEPSKSPVDPLVRSGADREITIADGKKLRRLGKTRIQPRKAGPAVSSLSAMPEDYEDSVDIVWHGEDF